MKILPLTLLLLAGFGAAAQTPPAGEADDAAAREELLRRAMRDALAASQAAPTNAATNVSQPAVAVQPPAVVAPASPAAVPVPAAVPPMVVTPAAVVAVPAPVVPAPSAVAPPVVVPAIPAPPAAATPVPAPVVVAPPAPAAPQPGNLPPVFGAATPVVAAAAAPPAVPEKPDPIIPASQLNIEDMDLNQFLEVYSTYVNRTILRPSNLQGQPITFKSKTDLRTSEAIRAFDAVLEMNGITTINVGDKFVKVIPTAQAAAEAGSFNETDKNNLPEIGGYVTKIVQIQYSKPSDLVQILAPFAKAPNSITALDSNQLLILRDFSENVKRMMELIEKLDVVVPLEFDSEVIPIKYAKVDDIASALSSLGAGTTGSIGRSSASPVTAGGTANRAGGPGALGAAGRTPGTPGAPPAAAPATPSLQTRLQQIVSRAAASGSGEFQIIGQTKIVADDRQNALLVFAGKQDMEVIKKIVAELDTVLPQVLIESIIMEVTLSDDQTLGVSYLQNQATSSKNNYFNGIGAIKNGTFLSQNNFSSIATNAAGALPSGFSYFATFGNDFQATLSAIANDHKVNVLSRPTIQTSHAVPAEIKIGDTVPYVTGTYFNGVNGTPNSQYQQTFVGIQVDVTPYINQDGLVVMDIKQDIQQLGTPTTIDGNSVPTTTQRSANASVSVRDGDTIMLGGFISTTRTKDKSGVPLLKDIPVLGYLFRSTADTNKRVELIVLIKPTVLPNPADAAIAATHERNRMPAVRSAQAEYEIDEAKRMKAGDLLQQERDAAALKAKQAATH